MEPLDALLQEEEKALNMTPEMLDAQADSYGVLKASYLARAAALPHLKNKPFIDLILWIGRKQLFTHQGFGDSLNSLHFASRLNVLTEREEAKVADRVRQIERDSGVTITNELLQQYLRQFAARVMEYARVSLAGISAEEATDEEWAAYYALGLNYRENDLTPALVRQDVGAVARYFTERIRMG